MAAVPKVAGLNVTATAQNLIDLAGSPNKWVRITKIMVSNNSSSASPGATITLKLLLGSSTTHLLCQDTPIPAKGAIDFSFLPSLFDLHFPYNATNSKLTVEGSTSLYVTAFYFEDDL